MYWNYILWEYGKEGDMLNSNIRCIEIVYGDSYYEGAAVE